jgi:hypothetical protein
MYCTAAYDVTKFSRASAQTYGRLIDESQIWDCQDWNRTDIAPEATGLSVAGRYTLELYTRGADSSVRSRGGLSRWRSDKALIIKGEFHALFAFACREQVSHDAIL